MNCHMLARESRDNKPADYKTIGDKDSPSYFKDMMHVSSPRNKKVAGLDTRVRIEDKNLHFTLSVV